MADYKPSLATGLPPDVKETRVRADLRVKEFERAIYSKGYRVFWSRAAICPCLNNEQTKQPDPLCPLCTGRGWTYFLPVLSVGNTGMDDYGNPVEFNQNRDGVLIYAVMTQAGKEPQAYEKFGQFVFGTVKVTTQWMNRMGYRDRLTHLDSLMCWSQHVEVKTDYQASIPITHGMNPHGLRYPVVAVHMIRDLNRIYQENEHWSLNPDGTIRWLTRDLRRGQLLSVTYDMHPVYIVIDHVFAVRDSPTQKALKATNRADQHQKFPVHAMARLDYLL